MAQGARDNAQLDAPFASLRMAKSGCPHTATPESRTVSKKPAAPAVSKVPTPRNRSRKIASEPASPDTTPPKAEPAPVALAVKTARATRKTKAVAPPVSTPAKKKRAPRGPKNVPPLLGVEAANDAQHAIAVYQIHFEPGQQKHLDPAFIPLDNAGHNDLLREFAVFERLARDEGVATLPLWGAMSWRFGEKTGISGADFIGNIEANPGFDLYFCNPNPQGEALFGNLWQQGMTTHPAFREVVKAFLEANGRSSSLMDLVEPSALFSSCNYFVGNQKFWTAYIPFVRQMVGQARASLSAPMLKIMDSGISDPKQIHRGASYWPFIVERLLPEFLRATGGTIRAHKVPLPTLDAKLNAHQKRLREMKDVAHRTRSTWLYSCWLNYRNLYLLQTAGRDWCANYLKLVSPTEIRFA